jgi:hypothetical protein
MEEDQENDQEENQENGQENEQENEQDMDNDRSGAHDYYTISNHPLPEQQHLSFGARNILLLINTHCEKILSANANGLEVSSFLKHITCGREDPMRPNNLSNIESCAQFSRNCEMSEAMERAAQFTYIINAIQFVSLATMCV